MLHNLVQKCLQGIRQKNSPVGSGSRWRKRAWLLCVIVAAFFVIGHFGVRFILWPQIEKSKPSLERLISARLGAKVTMDDVRVSWTWIRPSFVIDNLRIQDAKSSTTTPPLFIKTITGELSWLSFYHLAPFFHAISMDGVKVYAQRDAKGIISVGGIPIHNKSDDLSTENWLFKQDDIEISNAKIFWDDQEYKKPQKSIDVQRLQLSNGIRSHLGEITAITPWGSSPITIKANFVHHIGGQAGNWRDWAGALSWITSDFNLTQLSQDISLPLYRLQGQMNSNGNIKLDGGKINGGEMYLAANDLKIQLNVNENPVEFGRLETNLIQETDGSLNSVTTKTLAWRNVDTPSNAPLENLSPITFRWRPPVDGGEIKEFGFSSPKVLLEDITLFALNLPLSKKIHRWIKTANANGQLQHVDVTWSEGKSLLSTLPIPGNWFTSNKLDFTISAKLLDVSFTGVNKSMPSVSNLTGNLSSNQKQGSFTINSNLVGLEMSDFLSSPKLQFDRAQGDIRWTKQKDAWLVNAKNLKLSNPDITAAIDLSYFIGGPKQPDQMTLDMEIPNAKLATVHRYLPVGMDLDSRQYISKAFNLGDIENGSIHIKGDPNQIPFPAGTTGELVIKLPIVRAQFNPAPLLPAKQGMWQALNNVSGTVEMKLSALTVDIDQASYKNVLVSNVKSQIPNVSAKNLTLKINGAVKGEASEIIEYLSYSPVGIKNQNLVKDVSAKGPVNADVGIVLPLSGSEEVKVDAKIDLLGNKLHWRDYPPFENLKGKLRITEKNPSFDDISANFLGGTIKISGATSAPDNTSFKVNGDIQANYLKAYTLENFRSEVNSLLMGAMNGSANYAGLIRFSSTGSQTDLKFDLRNWAIAAPAPAKKLAGTPMLGELSFNTVTSSKANTIQASWNGKFGDQFFIQGNSSSENIISNAFGIGASAPIPQQGYAVHLVNNDFNLDHWLDFLDAGKSSIPNAHESKKNISDRNIQISAQIKKLTALEREWNDVNFSAFEKNKAWQLRFNSPQVVGQLQWHPESLDNPSGLINGRLTRFELPQQMTPATQPTSDTSSQTERSETKSISKREITPNSIPSLDLTIDDLGWTKAHLGLVQIKTQTKQNVLKIHSLKVSNPQGNSVITGEWTGKTAHSPDQSNLSIDMNVKDAGQIISRWGSPKTVENGEGKLTAKLSWASPIFSPLYTTLSGEANIDLSKGRLLEVNTDGAKLMDVLSLQSLLRFATFDLKGSLGNLATKGTPFNSVSGSFEIANGIAQTKRFSMILDQARVAVSGQINIPQETQDLRVTIFPTIDATAGSLAAFVINPIVGLGAVLGQYLITNQINRTMQTDYLVQGSWESPEVIPLDQKGQPLDEKTMNMIRTKDLLREQNKPSLPIPSPNNSSTNSPLLLPN